MRFAVRGIDRSGRTHTLLSMDAHFVTKVEIDTQCLDDEMRKDWFRTIVIEREVPISKQAELGHPGKKMGKKVGDQDHARIIELYFYGVDGRGMGITTVGELPKIGRSPATVRNHLMRHDLEVKSHGFCTKCKSVGGKYFEDEVYKTNARMEGKA